MNPPNPACRSCGSNSLLSLRCLIEAPSGPIPTCSTADFPFAFCSACTLVQRVQPVAPRVDTFLASTCPTRIRTAEVLARQTIETRRLDKSSLVIEAGSNDGWLLRYYREIGIPVLGLETNREAARMARHRHGIPTREVIFDKRTAETLCSQRLRADVFHAHDVLNRADELSDFVQGMRRVLRDNGVIMVGVPYVKDSLERQDSWAQEDSTFHFSLTALCHCLSGHGLVVEEAVCVDGTLRLCVVIAKAGAWPGASVAELLREEETWGVRTFETYAPLARQLQPLAA